MAALVSPAIRVVIADNRTLVRQGLSALIRNSSEFEVVGEASDGFEAVDQVATLAPEVLLINIQLSVLDGIAVASRIQDLEIATEIVFLASSLDDTLVQQAFEAGGRGFVLQSCDFEELSLALRKASIGEFYLSGAAGIDAVAGLIEPALRSRRSGGIVTKREREIARLLADGYSTKEAADILSISTKTAEAHRASIMRKLNARNVTDIVKYCIRSHIIEP